MPKEYKVLGYKATFEEYLVWLYLEELQEAGYIKEIIFQPESFELFKGLPKKFYKDKQLKTKVKRTYSKRQYLINPVKYTSDYEVYWDVTAYDIFTQLITCTELDLNIPFLALGGESYLEVKASTFDPQGTTRLFTSRTQPWLSEQLYYVQLIKPLTLFKDTFIPKKALEYLVYKKDVYTGKGRNRKLKAKIGDKKHKFEYKTLKEYLEC